MKLFSAKALFIICLLSIFPFSQGYAETNMNRVHIKVPIVNVYDYITQPDKWHDWYPDSASADTPGGSLTEGQSFTEVVKLNGTDVSFNYDVMESHFPSVWRVDYRSAIVAGSIQYELQETLNGTVLTRTLKYFPIANTPENYAALQRQAVSVQEKSVSALTALKRVLETHWLNRRP